MTDRAPLAACYYNKKCWTEAVSRTEKYSRVPAWPSIGSWEGAVDISIQQTIACHCQEKLGNIHESWAITMHNDMSLNENWNTSSPTHSPTLFVTPTSSRSKSRHNHFQFAYKLCSNWHGHWQSVIAPGSSTNPSIFFLPNSLILLVIIRKIFQFSKSDDQSNV